jgi:hypothetical protein
MLPWFLRLAGEEFKQEAKIIVKVIVNFIRKGDPLSRLKAGCLKGEKMGQVLKLKYLLRNS